MTGPHVRPEDARAMAARWQRRADALDADAAVGLARAEHREAVDAYDTARRRVEVASRALAVEEERVLRDLR